MADAITVKVLSDVRDLTRGLKKGERDVTSFGSKVKSKLGSVARIAGRAGKAVALGIGAGALAVGAFGATAIQAASDAQQSLGATETVFGRFADKVITTSDKAAKAYGLSASSYRENANLIGSLLKNQGVSLDQLAGKTEGMIKTAADLSATFGGSTKDAVEALSSAFKGEFDPLERYGISLKASTITTEAMRVANVKTTSAFEKLSVAEQAAAKQRATSNLITKQSKDAQGAFARETGTLAHQQQVLAARFENVKAKIGKVLLPIVTKIVGYISDTALPAFGKFARKAADLAKLGWGKLKAGRDAIRGIFENAKRGAEELGKIKRRVDAIDFSNLDARQVGEFFGTAVAKGLEAIVSLTGKITSTLGAMFAKVDWVGIGIEIGKQAPALLAGLAVGLLNFDLGSLLGGLAAHWQAVLIGILTIAFAPAKLIGPLTRVLARIPFVGRFLAQAVKWVSQAGTKLAKFGGDLFSALWRGLTNGRALPGAGIIARILGGLRGIPGRVRAFIEDLGVRLGVWALDAFEAIGRGARVATVGLLRFIVSIPGRILRGIGNVARLLFPKGTAAVESLLAGAQTRFANVISYVKGIPGRILGAIGDLSGLLLHVGEQLIQGLIQGLISGAQNLYNTAQSIANKVTGILKDAWKILSPSRVTRELGEQLMAGLTLGMTAGASKAAGKLKSIAKDLITQARAGFVEVTIGAAEQAVIDAAGRVKETVQKATDQQHQAAERAYEREYQARKKALEKTYDGKDLKRRLAALEKEHDAHVAALDKLYDRLTRKRLRQLRDEIGAVRGAAAAYDLTRASLDEWTQTLADRQQVFDDHVQSIRDMVAAYGDVSQLGQRALGDGTVTSAAGIVEDLQKRLIETQRFTALIAQLTQQGLNNTALQQLLAAGVEGGLAAAEAIAAGGAGAIGQINDLQAQLAAAGESLAQQTAQQFYGQGITAAQQMVTGLQTQLALQQADLEAAMRELGKAAANGIRKGIKDKDGETRAAIRDMADGMKRELLKAWGIKSPSRVFRTIGGQVVAGLTLGLDAGQVKASGVRLADALTAGFGTPTIGARLDPVAALDASATFASSQRVEIRLTAEQLSALQRGKAIEADRKAYIRAGGRPAS